MDVAAVEANAELRPRSGLILNPETAGAPTIKQFKGPLNDSIDESFNGPYSESLNSVVNQTGKPARRRRFLQ